MMTNAGSLVVKTTGAYDSPAISYAAMTTWTKQKEHERTGEGRNADPCSEGASSWEGIL